MTATAASPLLPTPAAEELHQREIELSNQAATLRREKAALQQAYEAARESVRAFSKELNDLHAIRAAVLTPEAVAAVKARIVKEVAAFSRLSPIGQAGEDPANFARQPVAALYVSECCAEVVPDYHKRVIEGAETLRTVIKQHDWDVPRLVAESLEGAGRTHRLPPDVVIAFLDPTRPLPELEGAK